MSAAAILARRAATLRSTGTSALSKGVSFRSESLVQNQSRSLPSLLARYYASKSFPPHTVVKMPALSPTMTAGNIGTWAKNPGDALHPGDVLVEIETDKAQMDFEFQDDGILAKILVESGEKDVAVGNPIAVYVEEGEDISAFADFTIADAGGAKSAPAPKEEAEEAPAPSKPAPAPAPAKESSAHETVSSGKPLETVEDRDTIKASPLAKKYALENGIPLKQVKGTGEGGRITKADVEKFKAPGAASSAAAAAPASAFTDIPLTGMRKSIASRLVGSKNTAPHYYVQSALNVSKLLKLRAALNATAEGKYKLSVNDFIIKAAAVALLKVPQVNSSWLEAEGVIRQYSAVDISVAVATPSGLITPIVKAANARGLQSISEEVKSLSEKARENRLKPEEFQGGTFTISNMGMNPAVDRFTAIINPPQAGILAVGTVKKVPVQGEDNAIEWVDEMIVSGSFDHRVVDGAVGAEFLKALKQVVENPLELLL
ncbi:dihydrolipoyllysine-residue acetyltransferase component of pyruvate dehydrogenase complex [Peziza echinospora]|nr:dihydrolipoyllysine-residue acetyltransferase component of pyruvate dehydrogenase complex [Peziza echinospora]